MIDIMIDINMFAFNTSNNGYMNCWCISIQCR